MAKKYFGISDILFALEEVGIPRSRRTIYRWFYEGTMHELINYEDRKDPVTGAWLMTKRELEDLVKIMQDK